MNIYIITDKYSKDNIMRSIGDRQDINFLLEENIMNYDFKNYLLIIDDDDQDFLKIVEAGTTSKLFDNIIICENLETTNLFINKINNSPLICTLDFKVGLPQNMWTDINALYNNIKLKFPQAMVIGHTHFESQTTDEIGDQASKLVELFRKHKDSVYDKIGMTPKTLANIFRDKIDLLKYQKEIEELRTKINHLEGFDEIIGKNEALRKILETISRITSTDARVLITGENGTGKELIAKALHKSSDRKDKPLIDVNCAAIPAELIESELFGHEKGSFTGAIAQRIGKFELANNGTLFLDEIGDMSLSAQAKILRAIEEGTIERVGGNLKITVDVRIISATNKDLKNEIQKGNFREDLYHRLNVIPICIPPLRERKEDIPLLVEHFSKTICDKNKILQKSYSESAMQAFKNYEWKGNVRELKNVIERIVFMSPEQEITNNEVNINLQPAVQREVDLLSSSNNFLEFQANCDKEFLLKHLNAHNWSISKTAKSIGIAVSLLHSLISKYNLDKTQYDKVIEIPSVVFPQETNDCLKAEIFLDKIESILIEHFSNILKVDQPNVAAKFTSTITGKSPISRGHFIEAELAPHRPCIEKLLTKYPSRWLNARTKCNFIKNAKAAKK